MLAQFPIPFPVGFEFVDSAPFSKPFTSNRSAKIPEVREIPFPQCFLNYPGQSNGFLHSFFGEEVRNWT